jgi:hypothetical protein
MSRARADAFIEAALRHGEKSMARELDKETWPLRRRQETTRARLEAFAGSAATIARKAELGGAVAKAGLVRSPVFNRDQLREIAERIAPTRRSRGLA